MIDTTQIKESIDCRDLIELDLGRPKYRNSNYNTYPCPLHNEEKGYSLVVYSDHWQCFGKCNQGGDSIAWVQAYRGVSFREACEQLSSGSFPQMKLMKQPKKIKGQSLAVLPNTTWQQSARRVAHEAMETLWGREGEKAWHYLEQVRGLSEKTIIDAGLGYIPGDYRQWRTLYGLNVPCGITIPWMTRDTIWGIKVRRAAGEQRYHQVAGGKIKDSLYLGDEVTPGLPVIITEGEIDALIAKQVGQGLISAVAIGSASNKHINPCWFNQLMSVPRLFILMDDDSAGDRAAIDIGAISQATHCVHVPQGKDINEFYQLVGHDIVRNWIKALITQV